jgi:L-arabinose isomerase
MSNLLKQSEVWFVTGSQHLYGPKTLEQVNTNSNIIAGAFDASADIPVRVVFRPVVTTPAEITALCMAANNTA